MFWFRRPPYLRWFAAGTLVVAAFGMDLRAGATTTHPFARIDIARGAAIGDADILWRDVPAGLLPVPDLHDANAASDISGGAPLMPDDLNAIAPVPDDWWAVPLGIPATTVRGGSVLLVMLDPPESVLGVVVAPGAVGSFGVAEAGLVAVPAADAAAVAAAAARGELTVLLEP